MSAARLPVVSLLIAAFLAQRAFAQTPYEAVFAGPTGGCAFEPFSGPAAEFSPDGPTSISIAAVAPAPGGRLFAARWTSRAAPLEQKGVQVAELRPDGSLTPISERVFDWEAVNLVVDRSGKTYVLAHPCLPGGGRCNDPGNDAILTFDAQGEAGPIHVLGPGYTTDPGWAAFGFSGMDLDADQCTIYLNQNGTVVRRFNVCTGSLVSDFATTAEEMRSLRILPDGGLLIAYANKIERYSAAGALTRTYAVSAGRGLGLVDGGTRVWVGRVCQYFEYQWFEMDLETGNVTRTGRLHDVIAPVSVVPYLGWSAALGAFHSAHIPALSTLALTILGAFLSLAAFLRLR